MSTVRQKVVTDRLREMIVNGAFKEGEHLQEIPLSRMMGVSRTPIREALVVLEHEGLLTYRQNRGYVTRSFSLTDVVNAYLVRETLEGTACRILAERGMSPGVEAEIANAISEGDRLISLLTTGEYLRRPWATMNARLHRTILHATGNAALIDATEKVLTLPFSSAQTIPWFEKDDLDSHESLKESHREHHRILEALRKRDPYLAETMMRGHISRAALQIQIRYSLKRAPVENPMLTASQATRAL